MFFEQPYWGYQTGGFSQTCLQKFKLFLAWNRLGLHPSEMMDVMEDREACWLNLEVQLPPQPSRKSGQ